MHVLLGVGGSQLSYRALDETIERAQEAGDEVTIAIFDNEAVDTDADEVQQRVEAALAETGFEASIRRIEESSPGSRLIEIAEQEEFDRIVLGGGERSTLGKIQLGSIVEFVLLNAQTPITLVR